MTVGGRRFGMSVRACCWRRRRVRRLKRRRSGRWILSREGNQQTRVPLKSELRATYVLEASRARDREVKLTEGRAMLESIPVVDGGTLHTWAQAFIEGRPAPLSQHRNSACVAHQGAPYCAASSNSPSSETHARHVTPSCAPPCPRPRNGGLPRAAAFGPVVDRGPAPTRGDALDHRTLGDRRLVGRRRPRPRPRSAAL